MIKADAAAEWPKVNEQKNALQAKGWTDKELEKNGWKPWPFDLKQWKADDENRNFLICPRCQKVGTWKPRYNEAHEHPFYWVCKWCGYARDYFGAWLYRPNGKTHVWGIVTEDSGKTPQELCHPLDPWLG